MADRTGRQAEVSEQIRVVVVDDHVAVRLGLAGSLGRLPATAGLRVVAQAAPPPISSGCSKKAPATSSCSTWFWTTRRIRPKRSPNS